MANAPHGDHNCAIFLGDEQGDDENASNQFEECKLHPGHTEFKSVDEILKESGLVDDLLAKLDNNPSQMEKEDIRKKIRKATCDKSRLCGLIHLTVRVVVKHVSVNRPYTYMNSKVPYPCSEIRGSMSIRHGTGYLLQRCDHAVNHSCPSKTSECQNSNSHYFIVKTATHVVFDKEEAENAVFELFFDTEDRCGIKQLYGVDVFYSKYLRLDTDTCFVLCVTHDDNLAAELDDLLWVNLCFNNIHLVSHPHGKRKRISVGGESKECITVIPKETCVTFRMKTRIRFADCDVDHITLVDDINSRFENPVMIFDYRFDYFTLRCDLTIYRFGGLIVDCDYYGIYKEEPHTKVWWNVAYPGTQLKTDDGNCYTFPYPPKVRMEVFVEKYLFLGEYNSVFISCRYNLATCPGSSGAHIDTNHHIQGHYVPGRVHHGSFGNYNQSTLWCIYRPDGKEHYETNDLDKWIGSNYKDIRREEYERLIEGTR